MKKIPGVVLLILALIWGFIIWLPMHDRAVRAEAAQRQHDVTLDSVVRVARQQTTADSLRFEHQRDSTGRVIASLRSRIDTANQNRESLKSSKPSAGGADSPKRRDASAQGPADGGSHGPPPGSCAGAPAQCDSLIVALTAGRQQDSLQLVFWQAQVAQRDTVIAQLQASRNAWRQRSERRWFCVGGATVAVGLNGRGAVGLGLTCGWRF